MSTVTIHLPNDLQEQVEDRARERGESIERFIASLLGEVMEVDTDPEAAISSLSAAELVALSRRLSARSPKLTDEEWQAHFDAVSEAMLQQAIANGTAIEPEDEEKFLEEGS
jgi:RecB family exonuclease